MKRSFNKILNALKDITSYDFKYVGDVLHIEFKFYPDVILYLNGRGLFKWIDESGSNHEIKFVMTEEMQKYVKKIYLRYKEA